MRLIFLGQGYPRKLFNLEHFPNLRYSQVSHLSVGDLNMKAMQLIKDKRKHHGTG